MQRDYFTITQAGCRIGYASSPITAVAAMSNGLLTFQRNSTVSDAAPISAVSQSPMAMRPSRMQADRTQRVVRARFDNPAALFRIRSVPALPLHFAQPELGRCELNAAQQVTHRDIRVQGVGLELID
jgi:hypothetical protein